MEVQQNRSCALHSGFLGCRASRFLHFLRILGFLLIAVDISICTEAQDRAAAHEFADLVIIEKASRTITLLNHGVVLRTYRVALGGNPLGPKVRIGDKRTPEGTYVIDAKYSHSRFHLALHISYPNSADRARALKLGVSPGGGIEIHGVESQYSWIGPLHRLIDWTAGCIAVTNTEIEEIYKLVPVGTPVEIFPEQKPMLHSDSSTSLPSGR